MLMFYQELRSQTRDNLLSAIKYKNPYLIQSFVEYERYIDRSYPHYLYKTLSSHSDLPARLTFNQETNVLSNSTKIGGPIHNFFGVYNSLSVLQWRSQVQNLGLGPNYISFCKELED